MKIKTAAWISVLMALTTILTVSQVAAQQGSGASYPDRPIKLVVPYPPGGSTDPAARLLAADIGTRLGQPVVVDNRPGAAGAIGTEAVVRAAPDGYTLLLHTSVISTDPTLKKNASYDIKRDLVPVSLAVTGPYLMVVNPTLPVRNVGELIAYARAHPGKVNFGSAGQGSSGHLIGELFKKAAGIDMVHVPYKGGGPSIAGLVGNEVQLVFDTFGGSRSLVEAGKLRAIAVTSPERSGLMPEIPTVMESGLKDFSAVYWLGIFAPAKTPQAVVDKLYRVLKGSLDSPAVRSRMMDQGNVPQGLSPSEFARVLDGDIQRYRSIIESARITID
ncbi:MULTISPECIES: Bug family tripartite tricarboxylate transporter substrate binding protein [Polaromonas]|uniref:Bug family tripartite tricarboxylate transporter substrate binding protein n=1 Tax=Polaromonas aquatica TaxID=332657 RepID=A0ABW1TWZ4_9BURK